MERSRLMLSMLAVFGLLAACAAPLQQAAHNDPHYTDVGFFDLHICNWPDRAPFFVALFSTAHYRDLAKIEVIQPDGKPLGLVDLKRYEVLQDEMGRERRAFKTQLTLPRTARDGWYSARVTLKNGEQHAARDYVNIKVLPQARVISPANGKDATAVTELRWEPVAGATHYRVFIRDVWQDKKLIYKSDLLTVPRLRLAPGLLQANGSYVWSVHARSGDDSAKWGEFNHGSLNPEASFAIADS